MFYRYELVPKEGEEDKHIGIVAGADEVFGDFFVAWGYTWSLCKWMEEPTCTMSDTISYFTEKGHKRFRKTMRRLCDEIERRGRKWRKIEKEELDQDNILYQDKYQVTLLRES